MFNDGDQSTDAQPELEHLRQQNHEQKLSLDRQVFMVGALTDECVALQAENDALKRRDALRESVLRELKGKLQGEGEEGCASKSRVEDEEGPAVEGLDHGLRQDLSLMRAENARLSEELIASEVNLKRLQGKNKNLEELVSESYSEVAALKEALRCARDECASLEQTLCSTREDHVHDKEVLEETRQALGEALARLSAQEVPGPLPARGNSVFAELEDSRVRLSDKYRALRVKHAALARRCGALMLEASRLRSDKLAIARRAVDQCARAERDTAEMTRVLEARVAELERANEEEEGDDNDDDSELRRMRRELDARSVEMLINQRRLNARKAQLRFYRVENLSLKTQLDDVRAQQLKQQHEALSDDDDETQSCSKSSGHSTSVAKQLTYEDKEPGKSQSGAGKQNPGRPMKPRLLTGLGQGDVVSRAAVQFQQQAGPSGTRVDTPDPESPATKRAVKKRYPKLVMHHKEK